MTIATHDYYLDLMGISRYERRDNPLPESVVEPVVVQKGTAPLDWEALKVQVAGCEACELCQTRQQTVFGVGSHTAEVLIVGEAPGAEEDKLGIPFVGRAGQLLTAMVEAIGLSRESIYIANILKCRPPNNRDPKAEERAQCTPFLEQQIALLQPKIIVAVGRVAAQVLLKSKLPLGKMRGQLFEYGVAKTPLIVTYHPAYLLRTPRDKKKAYEDLLFIAKQLS